MNKYEDYYFYIEELKPCPFCNSKNNIEIDDSYSSITCRNCGITFYAFAYNYSEAVKKWNELVSKVRRKDE